MSTRRSALLAGLGSAAAMAGPAFAGAEFWNDKQPSEWPGKDVQRMLTKSPWAKDASVQMNFSGMQEGPGGGPPQFKAVVRWESAAPVRAATKKDVVESDAGFYVISASGLPAPGPAAGSRAGKARPRAMPTGASRCGNK